MGWYHTQYAEEHADSPTAVSPTPSAACNGASPAVTPCQGGSSGPEELWEGTGLVYHLCQKSKWLEAVERNEAYFPPTFWSDGRFTRSTCEMTSLVKTANEYYKDINGEWLVLEIRSDVLRKAGIPIGTQRAPESKPSDPIQCLKLYGGISVNTLGLVGGVYVMQRSADGTFLRMFPDDSVDRMARCKSIDSTRPVPEKPLPEKKEVDKGRKTSFWKRSRKAKKY